MRTLCRTTCLFAIFVVGIAFAEEPSNEPKPVPVNREEVKQALEKLKHRTPRLPLPAPTEEEKATASKEFGLVNNARMRKLHLAPELTSGTPTTRERDTQMTFDSAFSTELFWIVSRANNCHYCLGHQEVKLRSTGLSEDKIAALDGDWEQYDAASQAAFAFTRKLTFEPHRITADDIAALKKHYSDMQVLEIVYLVSRYNSTNRWTDSLGIPQEDHRDFLTPTADKYKTFATTVAPRDPAAKSPAPAVMIPRPALEGREQVEAALVACRTREPRLPLVTEAQARAVMPTDWQEGPVPQWVRLLANYPKAGGTAIRQIRDTAEKGRLTPRLKAQIAWTAARHDRAWYALGQARQRLVELKSSEEPLFAFESKEKSGLSEADAAALAFARKLTVAPQRITDADIATLRKLFTDSQVAEIVHVTTLAANFDRLTEAAGLALE